MSRRRAWLLVAIALAAVAAVSALWAHAVGHETEGHSYGHLVPAAIVLAVFVAVVARRPPTSRGPSVAAGAFLLFAGSQIVESLAAHGWDEHQVVVKNHALTALHSLALVGSFVSLVVLVTGIALTASRVVRRRLEPPTGG